MTWVSFFIFLILKIQSETFPVLYKVKTSHFIFQFRPWTHNTQMKICSYGCLLSTLNTIHKLYVALWGRPKSAKNYFRTIFNPNLEPSYESCTAFACACDSATYTPDTTKHCWFWNVFVYILEFPHIIKILLLLFQDTGSTSNIWSEKNIHR